MIINIKTTNLVGSIWLIRLYVLIIILDIIAHHPYATIIWIITTALTYHTRFRMNDINHSKSLKLILNIKK